MVHRLDVRPVRIEDERRVVARVVRPLPRSAVVTTARGERSLVKAVDGLPVGRLKGEVEVGGNRAVARDEELVGGKPAVALADDPEPERRERTCIEALARLDVGNPQVDVVEEPAGVRFGHRLRA